MTKERKLAIQMWEQIVEALEQGKHDTKYARPIAQVIKEAFCEEHNLKWKCDCWFCQYVRHDYRANLPSRKNVEQSMNCCQECPLYKYLSSQQALRPDECGCNSVIGASLYSRVLDRLDVEAAELIMKALKGEEIWK